MRNIRADINVEKGKLDSFFAACVGAGRAVKGVNEVRVYGEKCQKNGLPLIVTEWSPSYSPTDPVHDHYFCAAYLLNTLKKCEGFAEMLSYWVISDIFEEVSPPTEPFHGGFGLMNMQAVPKPIYHAYAFLAELGEKELLSGDENAYVCKNERGVQVLAWNLSLPGKVENKKYFASEISNEAAESVAVLLGGFTAGKEYTVCRKTIGRGMGAPVTADSNGYIEFILEQRENHVDFAEIKF